jgi:hypothetical protein
LIISNKILTINFLFLTLTLQLGVTVMEKNTLLKIALICGKVVIGFMLLILLLFSAVFVHWQLRPAAYKGVLVYVDQDKVRFSKGDEVVLPSTDDVANKKTTGYKLEIPSSIGKEIYLGKELPIRDISNFSLYILSFQFVVGTLLLILVVRELLNIIRSVKGVKTFQTKNVQSFRKIGLQCLVLAVLRGFYFLDAEGISRMGFSLDFSLVAFVLAAYIMAEIFKEGNKLFEQDQLTI